MNKFLEGFDGLKSRTIFCLWTGYEQLSNNRLQAIWSIFNNVGCPVVFVTPVTLSEWILPESPLHPSYQYLSAVHKADYLRCYFMHHFGGGYTDLKLTSKKWGEFFNIIASSSKMALGYAELSHGIPHIAGDFGEVLRHSHTELIGLCSFIFKKKTVLTAEWLSKTDALLDLKQPLLKLNPAQHPMDQTGIMLPNGEVSSYPLRWAELLGEIFHPLIYRYRNEIQKEPIEPAFSEYR